MLVLTRFPKQGIRIGDDTLVSILGFEQNDAGAWQVRIGVLAPQNKAIWREELWNEKQITAAGESHEAN